MSTIRITLYLGESGLTAWLIKGINHRLRDIQGAAELIKIDTLQRVNVQHQLAALSLAFKPFDLCQIFLIGENLQTQVDALKLYLQQYCVLVADTYTATLHSSSPIPHDNFQFHHFSVPNKMSAKHRYHVMPFAKDATIVDKARILKLIAKMASIKHYKKIELQLIQREQLSSTDMAGGIALPHIVSEYIDQPMMICLTSKTAVDWQSAHRGVTHIVALLLPKPCTKEAILAVRHLAVNLLNADKKQFITYHYMGHQLQAILTCFMQPTEQSTEQYR